MRRFFIPKDRISGNIATLTDSETKHLRTVLRLNPGDPICLFDGEGVEYEAVISSFSSRSVEALIIKRRYYANKSPVHIIVAQAMLKKKKMDGLIRQLTELGIKKWIPFQADRSVFRPDPARVVTRIRRWEKIAMESLKQCRRNRTPEIMTPVSFETVLGYGSECDVRIVFRENESKPLQAGLQPSETHVSRRIIRKIMVMFGPEGGFSPQEIQAVQEAGFIAAALGPRVLRVETATVTGCALIQYLFGDMG